MKRNGCHNRPAFRPSMLAQDGWHPASADGQRTRTPRMVAIPFRMTEECQYVPPVAPDPGCDGCRWRRSP